MADQVEIHRKVRSEDVRERTEAVLDCSYNIAFITDKHQVGEDMHQLAHDDESNVRILIAGAIPSIIPHVPNKNQAWEDLIRLTSDTESDVLRGAAYALGSAFSHVPDKKQVWEDLHRLTSDSDSDVRASAYHSLGKASIFKAANAENDVDLKKEMEVAIGYFEQSSKQETDSKPARFCLPFYRSFYSLTFQKEEAEEEAEAEVKKYIAEAKSAIEGSESKEKLLEAVENLENALKEAKKVRDFRDVISDLNACRRYCDRACELLETTEEKAPGASRLIRKGLPIIDERIKGIIAQIQEKAKALCGETKNTTFRDAGLELNRIGQDFSQIRDPIGLEKSVYNMQTVLSAICAKMPEEERGEACTLLRQAKEEQYIEDKINLTNIVLGKISSQISAGKSMGKYIITNSQVQIAEGKGNVQIMDSSEKPKKESGLFDFMNKSAIAATIAGFGTFIFSEIFDIFPPNYNKHVISVILAIIIFTIILMLTRTYSNK